MPMIPDDDLDKMKRSIDLAAVIRSRGVELKPQGHDLVGLCPFHDDKNPSLHVTPAKGLWRCVSCNATGNVIQFVQKFDGVSFRHAYELLKNGAAFTGAPTCSPVKKGTVPRLASPLAADADDQAALRQVLDYYHERLKENPAALAYLKKRGITAEAVTTFRLGFVDRTLGLRLPHNNRKEGAEIRERLTRLGLLRDTGHEHLRGRVVFPVVAESGEIGTVYGRAIDDGGKHDRHLFLPGPQRGVFNPAALRSPEIIFCEGIIDALTFWGAGFRNVTTGYSAKALPEELLAAVVAAKVRRVLIAFDRDEAGDKGAAEVAAQLAAYGVECVRVLFPPGQDANSYALAVTPPDKSLAVLLRAALPMGELRSKSSKPEVSSPVAAAPSSLAAKAASEAAPITRAPEATATPNEAAKEEKPAANNAAAVPPVPVAAVNANGVVVAKNDAEEILLVIDEREYRVRGLAKNPGFESLKVTLRAACGERWHLDQVDLCVARQRENFVAAAAVETNLRPELLKRDLGKILGKLEELQEARLRAETAPKKPEADIPAALLEQARALARDPRLWDLIPEHAARCGIAGERVNVRVGYLGTVSRLLDRPLAIIIQSSSAAGKTTLMDATLAFVPLAARIKYSAMTGQSLFYMGGVDLAHKILAIVEEEGAEKASYALKLLQSEQELRIASTGKNPQTGRMETQEYHVQGPTMIFLTTTSHTLDEELQNRCLVLTVDESREQTERIHALQREARTEAGLGRKAQRDELLALHRAAQSLLQPLPVFNPYAEKLRFLSNQLRTRRDHEKYLLLIDALAVLFQHQRARRTIAGRACIVATLDDIARANELAHDVLGRGLDDMPPQTRRLLGLVQQMQRERAKSGGDGGHWRRRDLRAFTGWSDTALKVHLGRLVELEYVLASRDPEHLNGQLYELLFDGDPAAQRPHLSGLIDVEALRKQEYEKNRSGQNAGQSGVGQPLVRGQSGVGPGSENGDSSSENASPKRADAENAQPSGEENAA
ncbi:MAG: CHC2 zinc finger domain-containing protein [Opitutaceae bacterium]